MRVPIISAFVMRAFGLRAFVVRALGALVVVLPVLTACASARPGWVERTPSGYAHDYIVGAGADSSRMAAHAAAVAAALARAAEERTVRVAVTRTDTIEHVDRVVGGRPIPGAAVQRYRGLQAVSTSAEPVLVSGLQLVDEHSERTRRGSEVWVLMRRPRAGARPAPGPAALALRSALVPGWGQISKRQTRRGALILTAVALALPAAIMLDALSVDAGLRARRAQTEPARVFWRDRSNALGAARISAVAIAGTAWTFGVVDAGMRRPHDFYAMASPAMPAGRTVDATVLWSVTLQVPFARFTGDARALSAR